MSEKRLCFHLRWHNDKIISEICHPCYYFSVLIPESRVQASSAPRKHWPSDWTTPLCCLLRFDLVANCELRKKKEKKRTCSKQKEKKNIQYFFLLFFKATRTNTRSRECLPWQHLMTESRVGVWDSHIWTYLLLPDIGAIWPFARCRLNEETVICHLWHAALVSHMQIVLPPPSLNARGLPAGGWWALCSDSMWKDGASAMLPLMDSHRLKEENTLVTPSGQKENDALSTCKCFFFFKNKTKNKTFIYLFY